MKEELKSIAENRVFFLTTEVVAAVIALGALIIGSEFGKIHQGAFRTRLVAWVCAGLLLVFGLIAVSRLSKSAGRFISKQSAPIAGSTIRVVVAGVGYIFVFFSMLAVLEVSIAHVLVGAGLAGVVLGIAAQQSFGNVAAGLVLLLAKPFEVGDFVRVRSGALGGIFEATVEDMSLTYVTLSTEDGPLKIPNSAMLAAGVGHPKKGAI